MFSISAMSACPWDSPAVVQRSMHALSHTLAQTEPFSPTNVPTAQAAPSICGPCASLGRRSASPSTTVAAPESTTAASTAPSPPSAMSTTPKVTASLTSPPPIPLPATKYSAGHTSPHASTGAVMQTSRHASAGGTVSGFGSLRHRRSYRHSAALQTAKVHNAKMQSPPFPMGAKPSRSLRPCLAHRLHAWTPNAQTAPPASRCAERQRP